MPPWLKHFSAIPFPNLFVGRIPGVDAQTDRADALVRLDSHHAGAREALGLGERAFVTAEQVHGNAIACIETPARQTAAGTDGLLTNRRDVCLGIYVADCAAIYFADPKNNAIGLVHSGRKGTELGIAAAAILAMAKRFGSNPQDLIVQLSPCIRPPNYEIDFAAQIIAQCRAAGVVHLHDSGACTASNPEQYYSYRREKGRTGRMLALLALP